MKKWTVVLLSIATIVFFQNCGSRHEIIGSSTSSSNGVSLADAKSIAAYEKTLYAIVSDTNTCAQCHGVSQQPLHSLPDPAQAHDITLSFGLVDLNDPSQSKIVDKVRRGHQGINRDLADDIETAIEAWVTEVENSGGSVGSDPTVLQATFSSIKMNILEPRCVNCHSSSGSYPSVDYSSYVNTINTGGVEPGNAAASKMFTECSSGSMPKDTTPLSSQEVSAIQNWINQGALNN